MKFVLFAEGHTEHKAVPAFLKRWLDPKLSEPVGIQSVRFDGWAELVKDAPVKAELYLSRGDVIAVVALLDLYGPTFYPDDKNTPDERYEWAKRYLEEKSGRTSSFNSSQSTKWKLGCFPTRPSFRLRSGHKLRGCRDLPSG